MSHSHAAPLPGAELSRAELSHYGRHLLVPEIGVEGQRKLKNARVLMVGAGGLGSPLGLYLAAAGVGTLGIVEFDRIEASNLHRQVLYGADQVGQPKLDAAAARLRGVNPHITIRPHALRLDASNALELIAEYDLVVDGTDNFATRYLINDACVLLGKHNVHASIFRFDGMLSIFGAPGGPCYRCLYPEPPPPGLVPSCAEAGVLGVLPGIVGALQASETIKLLLGIGQPLVGRLLRFDALAMRFEEFAIAPDADCPICSSRASIKALVDYEQLCGMEAPGTEVAEVNVGELKARLGGAQRPLLLDVRGAAEAAIAAIDGAQLIPLPELETRLEELERTRDIVCYCQSGKRSRKAAQLLMAAGFAAVSSLEGGMEAWLQEEAAQQVQKGVAA